MRWNICMHFIYYFCFFLFAFHSFLLLLFTSTLCYVFNEYEQMVNTQPKYNRSLILNGINIKTKTKHIDYTRRRSIRLRWIRWSDRHPFRLRNSKIQANVNMNRVYALLIFKEVSLPKHLQPLTHSLYIEFIDEYT